MGDFGNGVVPTPLLPQFDPNDPLRVPSTTHTLGYGSVAAAAGLVRTTSMLHSFELSIGSSDLKRHRRRSEPAVQGNPKLPACQASFDFRLECPCSHPWRMLAPSSAEATMPALHCSAVRLPGPVLRAGPPASDGAMPPVVEDEDARRLETVYGMEAGELSWLPDDPSLAAKAEKSRAGDATSSKSSSASPGSGSGSKPSSSSPSQAVAADSSIDPLSPLAADVFIQVGMRRRRPWDCPCADLECWEPNRGGDSGRAFKAVQEAEAQEEEEEDEDEA